MLYQQILQFMYGTSSLIVPSLLWKIKNKISLSWNSRTDKKTKWIWDKIREIIFKYLFFVNSDTWEKRNRALNFSKQILLALQLWNLAVIHTFIHRWEVAAPLNNLSNPLSSSCTRSTCSSQNCGWTGQTTATYTMHNHLNQMDEYFLFTGVERTKTFIKKFNGWKRDQIWHSG